MSVISTPLATRRWLHFWPLALFVVLALGAGVWLWLEWPQVLMKSTVWQRDINREMSALLQQVAENPTRAAVRCCCLAWFMACCTRWGRVMAKW